MYASLDIYVCESNCICIVTKANFYVNAGYVIWIIIISWIESMSKKAAAQKKSIRCDRKNLGCLSSSTQKNKVNTRKTNADVFSYLNCNVKNSFFLSMNFVCWRCHLVNYFSIKIQVTHVFAHYLPNYLKMFLK